jgi:hypothetical protein
MLPFFTYFWHYVNAYITNEKTIYIKMRRAVGGTQRKRPIVARSPICARGPTQTDVDGHFGDRNASGR